MSSITKSNTKKYIKNKSTKLTKQKKSINQKKSKKTVKLVKIKDNSDTSDDSSKGNDDINYKETLFEKRLTMFMSKNKNKSSLDQVSIESDPSYIKKIYDTDSYHT